MIDPKNKPTPNYIKYSGIAFQMLATIGVFVFVGYKLDEHQHIDNSLFTAVFGIVGVAASLYQVIRSLNKEK
ncbi:AtpZ/AtpI family protein [Pedobacter xixiisoli]|uniref:F0F1-ATPase subunit Ca2+/Mg2+ transporter n=1 Tax=Pedobacter xixiisoli TaxID=1476464 RepID=A0A286AF55_9SPHI|nr:AtpZ/AtpI family protein [Pedobacter xixiisoli]SOD20497.1 Putative F0F1-ATPase subunit Ca2+/Mg2+ transporter [Pedobacter xixiisoli]